MNYKTQRELARDLGYNHTSDIRELVHSLRMKGYGVCATSNGMYRTESRQLKDNMASALLARAQEIMSAAEGLVRKDQDEMSLEEQMLWLALPERKLEEPEMKTKFNYITEEELR